MDQSKINKIADDLFHIAEMIEWLNNEGNRPEAIENYILEIENCLNELKEEFKPKDHEL